MVGRKYFSNNIFYTIFKKHFCPVCGKRLDKIKVSRVVNSKSPEAKNFDFQSVDNFMIGNVKFIWTEFRCDVCNRNYTIDKMRKIEKINELYNSIFCGNEMEFFYNGRHYYILPIWKEQKVVGVCFGEAYAENEIVCYSEEELYNACIEDTILGEIISEVKIVWTNF